MKGRLIFLFSAMFILAVSLNAIAGNQNPLDKELERIADKCDKYLVTIKSDGHWDGHSSTGIVYNADGYILAPSNLALGDDFEVTFSNGSSFEAELVGNDSYSGISVLKIDGDVDVDAPEWGKSSDIADGAWMLIVGKSDSDKPMMKIGNYERMTENGMIQLSLNDKPGSSGGVIVSTNGDVVAVVAGRDVGHFSDIFVGDVGLWKSKRNLIFLDEHLGDRILGLPVEQTQKIADAIIADGEYKRGYLGINQTTPDEDELEKYGLKGGSKVYRVVEDSPAEEAGLKENDIITQINGQWVRSTTDLHSKIRSYVPGDKVEITYYRDGEKQSTYVSLDEAEKKGVFSWNAFDSFPKKKVSEYIEWHDQSSFSDEVDELKDELKALKKELKDLKAELKK